MMYYQESDLKKKTIFVSFQLRLMRLIGFRGLGLESGFG